MYRTVKSIHICLNFLLLQQEVEEASQSWANLKISTKVYVTASLGCSFPHVLGCGITLESSLQLAKTCISWGLQCDLKKTKYRYPNWNSDQCLLTNFFFPLMETLTLALAYWFNHTLQNLWGKRLRPVCDFSPQDGASSTMALPTPRLFGGVWGGVF